MSDIESDFNFVTAAAPFYPQCSTAINALIDTIFDDDSDTAPTLPLIALHCALFQTSAFALFSAIGAGKEGKDDGIAAIEQFAEACRVFVTEVESTAIEAHILGPEGRAQMAEAEAQAEASDDVH